MANNNLLTLQLVPNSVTNSTTVTLSQSTAQSNSFVTSMTFAQQIVKAGGVLDDSNRWIHASGILFITIS